MVELALLVPADGVEWASDALIDELGALSVSVEDAEAGTADESALFGEPGMPAPGGAWRHSIVKSLFDDARAATAAASELLAQDASAGIRQLSISPVPDQDWVRLTQAQFEPVAITPAFWIVPSLRGTDRWAKSLPSKRWKAASGIWALMCTTLPAGPTLLP